MHSKNERRPIVSKLALLKSTVLSEPHPWNAVEPTAFKPVPPIMYSREVQPLKAELPMLVTESWSLTPFKLLVF